MSVVEIEKLSQCDDRWIWRALAADQAHRIAAPIREQREAQLMKERAAAQAEAERAAKRETARAMRRTTASVDGVRVFVDAEAD